MWWSIYNNYCFYYAISLICIVCKVTRLLYETESPFCCGPSGVYFSGIQVSNPHDGSMTIVECKGTECEFEGSWMRGVY